MSDDRDKCYRTKDGCGNDYVCSSCGLNLHRLWRDSHIMLNQITLLCAVCAELQEASNIAEYAKHRYVGEVYCGIGNLIPARATPDGTTFWGHTSGDVAWWYQLPQYVDPDREIDLLKRERDHFCRREEYALGDWLQSLKEIRELRDQITRLSAR